MPDARTQGAFADIGDKEFLLNIALNPLGDLNLQLRLLITQFDVAPSGTEADVAGEFRFTDETLADPPAATFETTLGDDGQMVISTGHVVVPAERSPVMGTEVEVDFNLRTTVLDDSRLCGVIDDDESVVLQPIQLQLKGTTFGGTVVGPSGELPADVPEQCPTGGTDAGADASLGAAG